MKDSIIKKLAPRSKTSEQQRLFAVLLLITICLFGEFTIGNNLEDTAIAKIAANKNLNWAEKRYACEQNQLPIQPKHTLHRILYLSNSHASTGGYVSRHLQALLDLIFPGEYEIINMSSPGMFAPEFLEKFTATTHYNIDTAIIPIAYISFADRMKLKNQAITAHSFLKPDIFPNLPLDFWWRNYDISLFTNKAVEHFFRLYKYRNNARNLWEKPLAQLLRQQMGAGRFSFLEVDEYQSWRFPDGFDRNLFAWKLYALGRKNHLQELNDLVTQAGERDVKILASNLPIDFPKDPHVVHSEDFKQFRKEISQIFAPVAGYFDYHDSFPKEFSTYDALHPTWHGARLHALHFAIQINQLRENKISEESIFATFKMSDNAISDEYRTQLNGLYTTSTDHSMRRYDIFEPENAKKLLVQLNSTQPGSNEETVILYQLSLRLYYWQQLHFKNSLEQAPIQENTFQGAIFTEIEKSHQRSLFFQTELIKLQQNRLAQFPLPTINENDLTSSTNIKIAQSRLITKKLYRPNDDTIVSCYIDNQSEKIIAFSLLNTTNKTSYTRIDLLGDNSFIQLSFSSQFNIPQWVFNAEAIKCFGI